MDWTLQFKRIGGTVFGPRFILCPLLDRLLVAMQDQLPWQSIGKVGCMTMAWAIHKGIRAALGPKRNFKFLKQVVLDFEIGRAPHLADMEEDIQARILAAAGNAMVPANQVLRLSILPARSRARTVLASEENSSTVKRSMAHLSRQHGKQTWKRFKPPKEDQEKSKRFSVRSF